MIKFNKTQQEALKQAQKLAQVSMSLNNFKDGDGRETLACLPVRSVDDAIRQLFKTAVLPTVWLDRLSERGVYEEQDWMEGVQGVAFEWFLEYAKEEAEISEKYTVDLGSTTILEVSPFNTEGILLERKQYNPETDDFERTCSRVVSLTGRFHEIKEKIRSDFAKLRNK